MNDDFDPPSPRGKVPGPVAVAAPWTPDRPGEKEITGSWAVAEALGVAATPELPATIGDIRAREVRVQEKIIERVASADLKWFIGTMAAVAVGAVILVGWFDARGAEREEKRIAPLEKKVEKLEADGIERDKHTVRIETMLENLSDKARVPVPPPVPPEIGKDGGR